MDPTQKILYEAETLRKEFLSLKEFPVTLYRKTNSEMD